MKQLSLFLAAACCALSFAACGSAPASVSVPPVSEPDTSVSEPDLVSSEPIFTDADEVFYQSELGYSLCYTESVFQLDPSEENCDLFSLITDKEMAAPVYVAVQHFPDMDARSVIDGVVLQSGLDGVEAYENYFGADGVASWSAYYEKDQDGVTTFHVFNAVPLDQGCLLVEIAEYLDMDELFEDKHDYFLTSCFETMMNSFVLN